MNSLIVFMLGIACGIVAALGFGIVMGLKMATKELSTPVMPDCNKCDKAKFWERSSQSTDTILWSEGG
jgi:ABC-type antimicrobial peptide transport system permease subunit